MVPPAQIPPPAYIAPPATYYNITLDATYQGACSDITTAQLALVLAQAFGAELPSSATVAPAFSCTPIAGSSNLTDGCLQVEGPATVTS